MQVRPEQALERADEGSYARGVAYASEGRVRVETRTRELVRAVVAGTVPYEVVLDGDDWSCSCPVGDGGSCKHCVAVAVVLLDEAAGAVHAEPPEHPMQRLRTYAERLDQRALVDLVLDAARTSDTFAKRVLATAAIVSGDLDMIKEQVRAMLPTRRHLDWRQSNEYAREAQEVVPLLAQLVDHGRATEAIPLVEDAFGRLNRLLRTADDSGGGIGTVARELLELHRRACAAGRPDPRRLASWLVKIGIDDDHGFSSPEVDQYAGALGQRGMAAYRSAVERRWAAGDRDHGLRHARERLARHDRDVATLVELFTDRPYGPSYYGLASTLLEIGLHDEGLHWAEQGIAAGGIILAQRNPYDLAVAEHLRRGDHETAVTLRMENLERTPVPEVYLALRRTAEAVGRWDELRDSAREVLRSRSVPALVVVLLTEGDHEEAWALAQGQSLPRDLWRALATARQRTHPEDAIPIFEDEVLAMLERADASRYREAAQRLRSLQRLTDQVDPERFGEFVRGLREEHRRRPRLIAELDRAGLP